MVIALTGFTDAGSAVTRMIELFRDYHLGKPAWKRHEIIKCD